MACMTESTQKRATVYFDPILHRALRIKAAETDTSVSELVNEALLASPPESRSTALRALALRTAAACGGRRALPAVDATLGSATEPTLRSEAIDALVALASPQRIMS